MHFTRHTFAATMNVFIQFFIDFFLSFCHDCTFKKAYLQSTNDPSVFQREISCKIALPGIPHIHALNIYLLKYIYICMASSYLKFQKWLLILDYEEDRVLFFRFHPFTCSPPIKSNKNQPSINMITPHIIFILEK